ncbi:hypothetical protein [Actinoallomurus sp. CA-142502]|uniref:hypothetical protein n=1 Tax=Actinoallomurus sp. CA-142502 TaxID=3239885 RepID=UPI003D916187
MSTISCRHELCGADHDENTPGPIRHHRVITDAHEEYRVVAHWIDGDLSTAHVELTFHGATLTMSPSDAVSWTRVLTVGGVRSSSYGPGTGDIAIDLGTAAEALMLLDPDSAPPDFGSYHLTRSIEREISRVFDDEEVDA